MMRLSIRLLIAMQFLCSAVGPAAAESKIINNLIADPLIVYGDEDASSELGSITRSEFEALDTKNDVEVLSISENMMLEVRFGELTGWVYQFGLDLNYDLSQAVPCNQDLTQIAGGRGIAGECPESGTEQ